MKKLVSLKIKAAGPDDGLEEGQFIGYASIFGNIDSYGDKVISGAFGKTLKEWGAKTDSAVIPLLYGHDMQDPNNNIGWVIEAEEDERGLKVLCQLDLDEIGNGRQAYKLVKGRRLSQMSFAYDVLDAEWVEGKNGEPTFYELRELKLYEVSLVPVGANPETELIAVKSVTQHVRQVVQNIKAGRVLSAKNEETLRSARESLTESVAAIDSVLTLVEGVDQEEEKASDEHPAKAEELSAEPPAVKAEEPSVKSSAAIRIRLTETYN